MIDHVPPESRSTPVPISAAFPCHLGSNCAETCGSEGGAFGDGSRQREHLCMNACQAGRARAVVAILDESWCKNPLQEGRIESPHPKSSKRKTQETAFPRKPSQHACLPPWKSSQEPGSTLGAFRELRMKAHSLSLTLIINLGCSEPVTHSTPLALELSRSWDPGSDDPGLRMGNASFVGSGMRLSGLRRAPGAKVGSFSPQTNTWLTSVD